MILKRMREERKVTLEQLCEGLCSVSTLSRIEAGKVVPKGYLLQAMMQRMGYHPEKYLSVFLGNASYEFWDKREALENAIVQRNVALAESLIIELEGKNEFKSGLSLQFLLNAKAAVMHINESFDNEKMKSLLLQSLRVTIPRFDEDCVEHYMLYPVTHKYFTKIW